MARRLGWTSTIAGLTAAAWGGGWATPPAPAKPVPEPSRPTPFEDPDAPMPWTIQIEPVAWFAGPAGKVKLPVTSGTGPGQFTTEGDQVHLSALDLDNSRLRPAGEVQINGGPWRFTFAGTDYTTSRTGAVAADTFRVGAVALSPGDRFDADFSLGVYELTAGYCLWEKDFQRDCTTPEDAVPVLVRLFVLAGARAYDARFDVLRTSGAAASSKYDGFFVEPLAGVRVEAELTRTFAIDLQLSGGGWPVGNPATYSFDVSVGFHYRPFENVAVQLGYRQVVLGLEDGEDLGKFQYDGSIGGLYTGVVIRF